MDFLDIFRLFQSILKLFEVEKYNWKNIDGNQGKKSQDNILVHVENVGKLTSNLP